MGEDYQNTRGGPRETTKLQQSFREALRTADAREARLDRWKNTAVGFEVENCQSRCLRARNVISREP
jgi:hypothetical protein